MKTSCESSKNKEIAPFLKGLYKILQKEDPSIIRWHGNGKAFEIRDMERLASDVLPNYFKHRKFSSFQRQLNYFGFKKVTKSNAPICTYQRQYFCRDDPHALYLIKRNAQCPDVKPKQEKLHHNSTTHQDSQFRKKTSEEIRWNLLSPNRNQILTNQLSTHSNQPTTTISTAQHPRNHLDAISLQYFDMNMGYLSPYDISSILYDQALWCTLENSSSSVDNSTSELDFPSSSSFA